MVVVEPLGHQRARVSDRLAHLVEGDDIDYRKWETFACSCEAYFGILASVASSAERRALAEEHGRVVRISEERVEAAEVAAIVQSATAARNGWKVILSTCAPYNRRPPGR